MSRPFKFKQFTIIQEQAAMKIGTDAVLLGAWSSPTSYNQMLDIGTGTGVLALQLAQRFNQSHIDAIDIDNDAYEEAQLNFTKSPWSDRISSYHQDLEIFIHHKGSTYDFIICNPPYFEGTYLPTGDKRTNARHNKSLDFNALLNCIYHGLTSEGQAAVIIPFQSEDIFLKLAQKHQLYPCKITRVKGNINSDIKRSLIQLSKDSCIPLIENTLTVEISRHVYTQEYINIVKDFYLKM